MELIFHTNIFLRTNGFHKETKVATFELINRNPCFQTSLLYYRVAIEVM